VPDIAFDGLGTNTGDGWRRVSDLLGSAGCGGHDHGEFDGGAVEDDRQLRLFVRPYRYAVCRHGTLPESLSTDVVRPGRYAGNHEASGIVADRLTGRADDGDLCAGYGSSCRVSDGSADPTG